MDGSSQAEQCGDVVNPTGCSHPVQRGSWHRQRGGSGALQEAGVDLEMGKNLAWHRAGGQCASLEAWLHNGMALLFPVPGWEATAFCPGSSVGILTGIEGWDARAEHCWGVVSAPTQHRVSGDSQLGNHRIME